MKKENERENVYKQMEEMMQKDDQREGMSEASKDMSDQTRGEDKSQMATKDQSDKTRGDTTDEREGDIETLRRMLEALSDYCVCTRGMVRALIYFTAKNGILPPDAEAFWREVEEAFEVSRADWVAALVRHNVSVELAPPSGEAITPERLVKADGDERESTPQPVAEMRAAITRELDCEICGRRTTHEFVGSGRMGEPGGCDGIIYRCRHCGHPYVVLRS